MCLPWPWNGVVSKAGVGACCSAVLTDGSNRSCKTFTCSKGSSSKMMHVALHKGKVMKAILFYYVQWNTYPFSFGMRKVEKTKLVCTHVELLKTIEMLELGLCSPYVCRIRTSVRQEFQTKYKLLERLERWVMKGHSEGEMNFWKSWVLLKVL